MLNLIFFVLLLLNVLILKQKNALTENPDGTNVILMIGVN